MQEEPPLKHDCNIENYPRDRSRAPVCSVWSITYNVPPRPTRDRPPRSRAPRRHTSAVHAARREHQLQLDMLICSLPGRPADNHASHASGTWTLCLFETRLRVAGGEASSPRTRVVPRASTSSRLGSWTPSNGMSCDAPPLCRYKRRARTTRAAIGHQWAAPFEASSAYTVAATRTPSTS
jgi:hypothetical protein